MRRDAPEKRTRKLIQKGEQSGCGPFWLAKLGAGALWISGASAPALHEPLTTPTVDVHSGLRMTVALDVLRHLWLRGPDSFALAHAMVWRHADSIADTIKYLQKHVPTPQLKTVIYTAIASGRVHTSRDAVPDDKALHKPFHGQAGLAGAGGLSRVQADMLHAYRDGWEWPPYMPRPEGSDTTPTTPRYRVPLTTPVATCGMS